MTSNFVLVVFLCLILSVGVGGLIGYLYRKRFGAVLESKNQQIADADQKIESLNVQLTETRSVLRDARNKADEAEKQRSTFVANLSHEIRIPLNSIVGFVSLLSKRNISEAQRVLYLENIAHSSNDLLRIIDDILDLSQIETGNVRIVRQNFELNDLMAELFKSFDETKGRRGKDKIEFTVATPEEEMPVFTDESRVKQILYNLISNAFKFTDKGSVEFGYTKKNDLIEFYVKDTGIGIARDHQEIILKRFTKPIGESNKSLAGIGFGLAIAGDLSKLLGGKLWLESEQGQGTTFFFTIPSQKPSDSSFYN